MYIASTEQPRKRSTRRKHAFVLSGPQIRLLELLKDEPWLTLAEFEAEHLYKSVDNVERALSGLISKGLIEHTVFQRNATQQVSYRLTTAGILFLSTLTR